MASSMESALKPLQTLLENLNSRLTAVESQVGGNSGVAPPAPTTSSSVDEELAPSIIAYDEYTASYLNPFLTTAKELDPTLESYGKIIDRAFNAQREFLLRASKCKKPTSSELMPLLKDLQECIKEMNGLRDNRSEFSHHQNMLSEGIQSLGWVCVEPAPRPFIESYVGGSDFWGNKIRVTFKNDNPKQIEFVSKFKTLLMELMSYVKQHHTTGVTWNPQGVPVGSYTAAPASAKVQTSNEAPAAGGMNAVFAGIKSVDQISGKTAGLRQVTKDMQTWRKEYSGGAKPAPVKAKGPATVFKKAAAAEAPMKDPVCALQRGNWAIEYQAGPDPITVSDINMKQQVYIFKCKNATIILEGKAKGIILDGCTNTKVIFDAAVSSMEIVNCKKVQVQCKLKVPSVAIDKTDGCLVYVSYEGKDVNIVTSKSSEMNIAFPKSADSDEYTETPIPEQFVHKICDDGKVSSEVSDLYA